jgi:phosphatidylserine/phosphatidylglycerophosphate/cardiolipin synthase-like enzyme
MPDITGRILIDETGAGVEGLQIELWRLDPNYGLVPHGTAVQTDPTGQFHTSYTRIGALVLGVQTIHLRAKDRVGRMVWKSPDQFMSPIGSDWNLGDIRVRRANLEGWRVTNLNPSGSATLVSDDNQVTFSVDNHASWGALEGEVNASTSEIHGQLFYLDVEKLFIHFTPDPPAIGAPTDGSRLEDLLLAANRRPQPAAVRLLVRGGAPYPITTAGPVEAYFAAATNHTVEVRRFTTSVSLPMHAKVVVIDRRLGHVMGSPLIQEYFDDTGHAIDNPRRGPFRFPRNAIKVPVHDVDVVVRGSSAAHLDDTFRLHWDSVGPVLPPPGPTPASPQATTVQVVRSLPGGTFPGLPDGEAGVLEAYQRAFANATDFVYLETQYVNNWDILETIRLALRAKPALQVIVLFNSAVDIPGYQGWQDRRLTQLKGDLTRDGTIERLGLFTLWIHDDSASPNRIARCYVHGGRGITDDRWATVGTANLDGVSLHTGEHIFPLVYVPATEHQRATEVQVIIYDGIDGAQPSTVPRDLRRALWAEHLGLMPTDTALSNRPAGGWLQLWRNAANAKLAGLRSAPPIRHPSRILEWLPEKSPVNYLRRAGVNVRALNVLTYVRSFDFATGNWE